MSSLRLALKQSLAETGHLAIQDKSKRKHNHASSRDLDRKRRIRKQKLSSSNKIASRRKKHFSLDSDERIIKKETLNEFSAESGRPMSSASDSSSFANSADEDADANIRVGTHGLNSADYDDAQSLSSNEASSFSDSDTVTNESSCSSHHRHHHRMHSSEDDDSSSNSQSGRDRMQEDMEGVFDMEGTSADESYDHNPRINPTMRTPIFKPQQQQCLQPEGLHGAHQHEQTLRKKKKKKKKDKGKRKKDRQKLNIGSSGSSIKREENKLPEQGNVNECEERRSHDGAHALFQKQKVDNQASMPLHDMGNEPCPLILRRATVQKEASSHKMMVKKPSRDVLAWVSGMSQGKQRRKIKVGMRVKVCFEFKSNKRVSYRWCGGVVTLVGLDGTQIRILYDDGTEENTVFPDREIVVDDNGNGKHQVPVDAFLPKQPAILMAMNVANQGTDLDEKIEKEVHHKQGIVTANGGNNNGETAIAQEISPLNVKAESLEEAGVLRQHFDPPNELENCAPRIPHEPLIRCASKNNIKESSFTIGQSEFEGGTAVDTKNFPSSPSWESNNTGRSFHQSGSSPDQMTTSVGAGIQDVRVSKKIKLKRRKSPIPHNHINNRTKINGIDTALENTGAHSASNNVTRSENCIPSLKIRLKTKSVKHKKRMDNTTNTNSAVGVSDFSRIKIKCDQEESNVGECWTSIPSAPTNSDETELNKARKSFAYAQGDSAWLGDDEGQGLKRSYSELEEVSESEKDSTTVPPKVSDQAFIAGKMNLDYHPKATNKVASLNNAEISPIATPDVDRCNTPVMNLLFKGRKHSTDKFSKKDGSIKSNTIRHPSPVSVPLASVPSLGGMAKKKKPRSHNSTLPSHKSSVVRSPKPGKVGRFERQACNNPSLPLQENYGASGKKSKKERRLSPEQISLLNNNNISKLNKNGKESLKNMREQPQQCHDKGSNLGDKPPILPLRSGINCEDGNSKHPIFNGRRAVLQDVALKAKRKSKSKNGGLHRSMKEDDREDNSEVGNWVQCDHCNKWRCVPNSVDVDTLPEHWYCKDNPDKSHSTCEAAEQTSAEVKKEKELQNSVADNIAPNKPQLLSPLTVQNKRPSAHNWPIDQDSASKKPLVDNNDEMMDDTKLDMMRFVSGSPQYDSAVTNKSVSSELPDDQIAHVRMAAGVLPEEGVSGGEIDGGASDGTAVSALPGNKNMKGSSKRNRRGKGDEKDKKSSKGKKQKEAVNQEWVQCEKCEKWRRLPPRIKAKELPEVWTCDMNNWDPRSASCAVQEDYNEKAINPDKDIIGKDGLSSVVHTNKLSYRNLIRIPNRTISERTRAADSLFSSCATDPDRPPTVMYANSSAFQHKGGIHKSVEEDTSTISLFAYMSKSELWKDLYQYTLQPTSNSSENLETASRKTKMQVSEEHFQSMKAMVYYALGMRTLAIHDVLLECQCREWDDLQWIDLRAICTLKSVQLALNALVKDGLVEASPNHSTLGEAKFDMISYCRVQIGRNITCSEGVNVGTKKVKSGCMKISKPWKRSRIGTGF